MYYECSLGFMPKESIRPHNKMIVNHHMVSENWTHDLLTVEPSISPVILKLFNLFCFILFCLENDDLKLSFQGGEILKLYYTNIARFCKNRILNYY